MDLDSSSYDSVQFVTLNCAGFKQNSTYIDHLCRKYDCLFFNETWLTKAEEHLLDYYKRDFHVLFQQAAKNSAGRPFGGTALFMRKCYFKKFILIIQEDFITSIKTYLNDQEFIISGVYLQSLSASSDCIDTYNAQLATVSGIIEQFIDSCEIVILGDFQSYPSNFASSTRSAQENRLSKHLAEFISSNNLNPIDITHGSGPTYTYQHLSLSNHSYIDHIITSMDIVTSFSNTSVLAPASLNTGDHLPVTSSLMIPNTTDQSQETFQSDNQRTNVPNYIWNNDRFVSIYNQQISSSIDSLLLSGHDLEKDILLLNDFLLQCASDSYFQLNSSARKFPAKRWWNRELTTARNNLSKCFNAWRDIEFVRSPDNVIYQRYLFARKKFRNMVKHYKNQENIEHFINVDKLRKIKPKSYWKNIKLAKNSQHKLYTINGKTTSQEITSEFQQHFHHLLNVPRTENIDNSSSNEKLKTLLSDLEKQTDSDFYVSECEVRKAINRLSKDKTRDPFNLKAEHFIFAVSDSFAPKITELINRIFQSKDIPPSLSTSMILPLVKSFKKSLKDPNNYRGISIIPILTKIIELIIIDKCPSLKDHNTHQFGFVSGSSTIHAELLIKDTIKLYNRNNSPVFICSLDAEKAFDSCNWYALFKKLVDRGDFPATVLKIVINLYMNSEAKVKYNDHLSSPFKFSQGVRQGSLISPYLYNIYTEDLLLSIQRLNLGTLLANKDTSIIAYADDIILLSPTLKGLQLMIDKCIEYGLTHGLKFNHVKTQFCISGKSHLNDPTLEMYGKSVSPRETLEHLGFKWKKQNNVLQLGFHRENRIAEIWSVTSSLISAGIRNTHPNIIVDLFKSVVIPKLLYGMEIVNLSFTEMNQLNIQARSCLKALLGVSKHSRNLISQVYTLPDVSLILQKRRILLIDQLLNNKSTKEYLFLLGSLESDLRSYSVCNVLFDVAMEYNVDVVDCLMGIKPSNFPWMKCVREIDDDALMCKFHIDNWFSYDHRIAFKYLLENRIY